MGIGKAAILGLVAAGSTIVLSVVRTKVTAHYLGPAGVGRVAEVLQVVALAMLPAGLFVGPALISQVAAAREARDWARQQRLASTALVGSLVVGSVGAVGAVTTAAWVVFPGWADAWPLTTAACVAALVTSIAAIPGQVLTGIGRLKPVTLISIIISGVGALSVSVGTAAFGLRGHLVASALGGVLCLPIAWLIARRAARELSWLPRFDVDLPALLAMAKLGIAALVAATAMQTSLSVIRYQLGAHEGPEANGLFQAAWALGGAYFGIASSSIGAFAFPRYAAARTPEALTSEVDATIAFILRALPPILLLAMAFRKVVVDTLYTPAFGAAADVLGLLIAGDLARAICWAQAGPLLYRARLRAFLLAETFAAGLLISAVAITVPKLGLVGPGFAYVGTYVAYMAVTSFVLRASCGVPIRPTRILFGVAGTAGAIGVMVLVDRHPAARWMVCAVAALWWVAAGRASLALTRAATFWRRLRG